ncbi:unnamed protein product [Anisakis simplex]|uniref:Ovule protein n=1 Tax=Anisakis simplex TaxID=6269 RepID=A0A0M3JBR7_ANISI|nr:unnamed protein product [Anisakis simplex]
MTNKGGSKGHERSPKGQRSKVTNQFQCRTSSARPHHQAPLKCPQETAVQTDGALPLLIECVECSSNLATSQNSSSQQLAEKFF